MKKSVRSDLRLLAVIGAIVLMSAMVGSGVVWAAPPLQGTIPPPDGTPVFPPPVQPQVLPGLPTCCLPGVAFTSARDGNDEIYIIRYDGTGLTRLTNHSALDSNPAPSPDGTRIAFVSSRDDPDPLTCGKDGKPNCVLHIYVMNVDGSHLTRLTNTPAQDTTPIWSTGGSAIAFVSNRDDPDPKTCGQPGKPACVTHVYMMGVDGAGQTRVTSNPAATPGAANWDPNFSPDDTKLAFVSNRDGNSEIYVVSVDGGTPTRLTSNVAADVHPAWSPDGKFIVFETNRDGQSRIYVMNADGTNQTRLTSPQGEDRTPIWLPGCAERIVFSSNREGGAFRIFAIDPDGANMVRLTSLPAGQTAADTFPAWSGLPEVLRIPGGACCVPGIVFDSVRDGNEEIYIMRDDGARITRLTTNAARDARPAPSPNGTQIAFQSNRDGRFQLYVMNVDGSGTSRLTNSIGDDTEPVWSNDGARLAFVSTRDDPDPRTCGQAGRPACVTHVYTMNARGGDALRITTNPTTTLSALNFSPVWSPDNKRVAFVSNRDGNDEIYVANADGSGLTRLTNNAAVDGHPSFSADGTRIVFESNRDGKFQLYIMKVDGTDVKRLTTSTGDDRRPYWCPSCLERITFTSNRDGVNLVYAINADGSALVRLTSALPNVTWSDDNPAWAGLPARLPIPVPLLKFSPTPTPRP